jgi:hypothetical protein
MWNAIKRILELPTTDAEYSAFVDTVADEPTRVVVRIRFRPPQERTFFRFYVELIVDDSAYLPNNRL